MPYIEQWSRINLISPQFSTLSSSIFSLEMEKQQQTFKQLIDKLVIGLLLFLDAPAYLCFKLSLNECVSD